MNDQDKNIAVLTAHMEHLVRDMGEVKNDLKAIPDKMATQYVPKIEFDEHRKDHAELRMDVKSLITKIDSGQFLSKEDGKSYVTQDQFWPFKYALIFVVGTVATGIIKILFDIFSKFSHIS